ncbi:hypothetical protein ACQ4PT_001306 [Festuca glaucescens]
MASPSRKKSSSSRRDRISGLPDNVLGHVLSFLPNKEAARAALLARRWRHAFGSVHTISFEDEEGEREDDWITFYYESEERKSCSEGILDGIGAALLCRRRCAGALQVPLRSFRFAFDSWHWWDKVAIDQWLAYVLPRRDCDSHPGLHLDLRFHISSVCALNERRRDAGSNSDDDGDDNRWRYLLPRRLFSCTALQTLCITYCRLKLPNINAVKLPFLETMRLTALGDSGRNIQRLISSCPRLVDLTLEALWNLKRVSVLDKRLLRLAIHCCHNLKSIDIDASELRSRDYSGREPAESFLTLHGSPETTTSCTISLCKALSKEAEFAKLTSFLEKISNAKHLHLHHGSLENKFFDVGFPLFPSLTWLTLQGRIDSSSTVIAVGRILEQTPNLEVLSLLMRESEDREAVRVSDEITTPDKPIFSIPCLRLRVREIILDDYEGSKPEKMLVKLLLRNALVLERLQLVFTEGVSSMRKNKLEVQIGRWAVPNSEKFFI